MRGLRSCAWALVLSMLPACSGGGGGSGGPPAVLAGQWMVWLTVNSEEIGPFATCLTQSGASIGGVGMTGSVSGNTFTLTNDDLGGLTVQFQGASTGNQASGTFAVQGSSLIGAFRMQTFAPAGALTMSGTVNGVSPAVSTTIASGRREYSDMAHTMLEDLEVACDDGLVRTHLTFGATGFTTGTLAVGGGGITATVSYETGGSVFDLTANGGSVTVTRDDASGMAGSYTLNFVGGGSLSGSFDVAWDMDAYQPP
ncbi:MAG: hypothetical protein R3F56_07815 [Planctomycetota bacterium]